MIRLFFENIELTLSAAGLVVIAVMPQLLAGVFPNLWMTATITAAIVGVFHGIIFWLLHRRERQIRKNAMVQIQAMLRDVINNRLAYAVMASELGEPVSLTTVAQEISGMLDNLNETELRAWMRKYPHATPQV